MDNHVNVKFLAQRIKNNRQNEITASISGVHLRCTNNIHRILSQR